MEKVIKQLSWGAESNLYLIKYLGKTCVLKKRIMKTYMNKHLAEKLLLKRTIMEARLLYEANAVGVPSPYPLRVDPLKNIIIMSYIRGFLLKNLLDKEGLSINMKGLIEKLGLYIAVLHNKNIVHGDLTTSNIIYSKRKNRLYIIDYGLSFKSRRAEDKAMDLRVLERSVLSTHPTLSNEFMNIFLKDYFRGVSESGLIKERLNNIRRRGRYVGAR